MSIRWKMIIVLMVLVTMLTVFLGYNNFKDGQTILAEELKVTSSETVEQVVNVTDVFMDSVEKTVNILSSDPNVQQVLVNPDSRTWMMETFKGIKDSDENIMNIYIGTQTGQMFIYPEQDLGDDYDPRTRPWYKAAVETDGIIWTEAYKDAGSGKLVVSVAKPVYNERNYGEFVGVVSIDISLDTLTNVVNNIKLGEKGYLALTDSKGITMAHPDPELVGKRVPIEELVNAITSKDAGNLDFTFEGTERLGIFNTISKTGWKIVGIIPYSEIEEDTSIIFRNSIRNGIIVLVVAILLGLFFSRFITSSLNNLVEDVKKIGSGDFTVKCKVKTKDEIGTLAKTLNQMIKDLGVLIKNVQSSSEQLASSSQQLTATSQQSTTAAEEVARTIEEIAKSANEQAEDTEKGAQKTNELGEIVEGDQELMSQLNIAANKVDELKDEGIKSIQELTERTEQNSKASQEVHRVVLETNESTEKISASSKMIQNIAEQINLLALNAAIEAARAGEAGKGFAVVADEIRKLAEETDQFTKEIEEVVNDLQVKSKDAVDTMEKTTKYIKEQNESVEDTREKFEGIADSIEKTKDIINKLNVSGKQLTEKKNEILSVMENLSAISEENAASTEEASASIEEQSASMEEIANASEALSELAQELQSAIVKFKV
ncbi:methyl-accepting chemotaxis protein [Thermohalobacter berrensis]|uniref:Chemotaxis protein n=1 Tax=Thermohalobacter berrensis TaxID=99594 RepID=A0A419T4K1_9FIRM|nr:methyl-accepting chemotaxis protein [Thermohalobacter berrensis]RKD32308.1 hypothetical protein BET03_03080 [Thermohalobacter berrensis]